MTTVTPPPWRNRICGYGEESPDDLCANPRNWRLHPQPQQDALLAVMREVGIVQDVIVSRNSGYVVDGHLRVLLAMKEGQPALPVTYVDLTPDEERKIILTFDPIGAMAAADNDALDSLLRDVSTADTALQAMLSDLATQNGLEYGTPKPAGSGDVPDALLDQAAELQQKWQTAPGQLWVIPSATGAGAHRLLCGDSTQPAALARLLAGERAAFGFADPPYNVGIAYGEATDDQQPEAHYAAFHDAWWPLWAAGVDGPLAATVGIVNLAQWCASRPPSWIIAWVKMNGVSHTMFGGPNKWEPVLVWRTPRDYGSDLIQANNHYSGKVEDGGAHPVAKPVELLTALLERFCPIGSSVLDPFAGSGTTLCAAEATGRRAFGCEVEPKYAAACLERLSLMGLAPYLEGAA